MDGRTSTRGGHVQWAPPHSMSSLNEAQGNLPNFKLAGSVWPPRAAGPADSDSTTDGGREGVHKGSTLACCVWHLHRWHCMPGSRRRSLRTATAARLPSRAVWGAVCLEPAFAVVPTPARSRSPAASSVRSAALAKPSTCIVDQLLSVTSHQHSDLERR